MRTFNRPMVIAAVSAVLAVAAVAYAAGKTSAPQVVQAQSFQLVNSDGKVLATLGPLAGGHGLALHGKDGITQVGLGIAADGRPGLALSDSRQRLRALVVIASDGSPTFHLYDETGKPIFKAP